MDVDNFLKSQRRSIEEDARRLNLITQIKNEECDNNNGNLESVKEHVIDYDKSDDSDLNHNDNNKENISEITEEDNPFAMYDRINNKDSTFEKSLKVLEKSRNVKVCF